MFWWHKPLDIELPTHVRVSSGDDGDSARLAAFLWLKSELYNKKILLSPCSKKEREAWKMQRTDPEQMLQEKEPLSSESPIDSGEVEIKGLYLDRYPLTDEEQGFSFYSTDEEQLFTKAINLAAGLIQNHCQLVGFSRTATNRPPDSFHDWEEKHLFYDLSWSYSPSEMRTFFFCLYLSGIFYGGLHALAWNASFDSSTEKLLWRVSSVAILMFAPSWHLALAMEKRWEAWVHRCHHRFRSAFRDGVVTSPGILFATASLLPRCYLVVQCFLALGHSPPGIYDVPRCLTYFPHFS